MKFNVATSTTRTINLAGGEAFRESAELELVSLISTSFVEDQFYRSADATLGRLRELLDATDPQFAAKAGIYARNELGMRSITHALAAELAHRVKGEQWTRGFFDAVVRRPDDMTEILAYYCGQYGKPIPNALKKGLARAFGKFDAYQLAKYRSERAALSLVDVANLVHPKPTDGNRDALRDLIAGTLTSTDTWESELTRAGQAAEDDDDLQRRKAKVWSDLVRERKIGYFALLRNLRNIIDQAPEVDDDALAMLTDANLIRGSLVLPFRYATAAKALMEVEGSAARKALQAVDRAADLALANVPQLDGDTLVVLDASGSMMGKPIEIGSLFAAVLAKANNADVMLFANEAAHVNYNPSDTTLTLAANLMQHATYGGTNFHAPFQLASRCYARIIVLSDMQGWIGYDSPTQTFAQYKQRTGADPFVYSFDLQGYGTLQMPERQVYCLAGFSEKVLDVMALLEQDRKALTRAIEAVEL